MKTVILIAKYPYGSDRADEQKTCNEIYRSAKEKCKGIAGLEQLGPDAWLIELPNGLAFFCWLVAILNDAKFGCRIASFDETPCWQEAS